ncbi:MAG: signal peptide peptidase SppA [Alphaproteobacteria bacterium]
MLRFLSTVLAVVVGLFLFVFVFFMLLVGVIAGAAGTAKKSMPQQIVLELDAREPISDAPSVIDVTSLGTSNLSVVGIVEALETAKKDPNVKGLLIRADSSLGVEPGQAEEIREAIMDFKTSGKFVISHVQDLSDPGLGGYYLASAADQMWISPGGFIFSQGVGSTGTYFKGTLDKLDSSAQVLNYYEYKSAAFPFVNTGPTDAEREENLRLITTVFESFTGAIANSRDMTRDQFVSLLKGPYTGEEAVKMGWVDKVGFESEAEDAAKKRAGSDGDPVDIADYAQKKGSPYKSGAVIAFIQGQGEIVDGEARPSFLGSTNQFGGDTVADAFEDAVKDNDVKAIVFRVNSPGGSPTASDQVWNAVARARAKGKPVVVDMSGVAASGGYWISMNADKIIAEPSTITGSIGVVGLKFVLKGLYDKLGVTTSELSVGGDKQFMFSDQHPFTPEEWLAYRKVFDTTYGTFVSKVAAGRKLPLDTVKDIARGRVWSGTDAKDRGLVDAIGGLKVAIASAKDLAHIAKDAPVQLKSFPPEKSFIEQLFTAFGASADVAHSLGVFAEVMKLQPTTEVINALKAREAQGTDPVSARMAPITVH